MDQPQERKYCFQARTFKKDRSQAAYIPGMPTMSAPRNYEFETVAEFVDRYNTTKKYWERLAREWKYEDLRITKDNFCELGQLRIPTGVNQRSRIKPSEDWFKERPEIYEYWESKKKSFREGEEIVEAKDSTFIHVTQHKVDSGLYILEPTSRNDPSQPVLPPNGAQQSVQPFFNTAGSLLAKLNPTPDLQRHSKLNDDPINPSTSSSISKPSITNTASQLMSRTNGNQQIVSPAVNTAGSSVTLAQVHHRRSRSVLNDDPINTNNSFLIPSQTPPSNSNPSSATSGATTGPVGGANSSTNGGINR
ncbi:hypothetical protein BCON_1112g00010 [Botryotinia convoluta]|uniref:Uncharacterized protein n=1 Tax=Botryotinia convoluta TaxID=54673 RepID=A0A4Z1H3V0_9HELO|nr:hypothetical protein BCON_1112g00010 [Botryotinia convoluta]